MNRQKSDSSRPRRQRATTQSKPSLSKVSKPQERPSVQPAPDDREGWKIHWAERHQPWRTEPAIGMARQRELATRYAVIPDIKQGIYPFRDMKLNRADVEWLLNTYKDSFTPKEGLDVRGADLNEEDLSKLPLSGLRGVKAQLEWRWCVYINCW